MVELRAPGTLLIERLDKTGERHVISIESEDLLRGRFYEILLQKSLMVSTIDDSLALTRFVVEAGDDGAAQSRPRAAVLFISS